jgi:hypothetical protein
MRTIVPLLAMTAALAGCGKDSSKQREPAPPPPVTPTAVGQPMTATGSQAGSAGTAGSATGSQAGSATTSATPAPAPLPPLAADTGKQLGAPVWSSSAGGEQVDLGRAIAVAPDGTVYVAGDFEGKATFGAAGELTSAGKSDAVLVRVAADGNLAAAWPLGGANQERGDAVAVDAEGNVAFGGLFSDQITFGGIAAKANGSDDAFVAGLDGKGAVQWLWTAGGLDSDDTAAIAAVPGGGWLVAVSFARVITVGGIELTSHGGDDVALVRLSKAGDVRWVTQLGGEGYDLINRLALDPAGNIYALGAFKERTDLGGGPLDSAGALDLVIARFDAGGKHVWSKRVGNPFNEKPGGLAVDPAGGIVITGSFDKDVDFLGTPILSKGESVIFVARLGGDGALAWVKTYGAEREDAGFGVAVDAAGTAVVTGWFEGKVDFGGGPLAGKGYHDVFVLRLARDGAYRGAIRFGGQDYDEGRAIALAPDGATVATGVYRYENDLGPQKPVARQAPGTRFAKPDLFIVKLAP